MAKREPTGSASNGRKLTKLELEYKGLHYRHQFWMLIGTGAIVILLILASAAPLWVVKLTVEALAGKETKVPISLATMVAAMVGGGGAMAVIVTTFVKSTQRKRELVRLRQRVTGLESELARAQGRLAAE